MRVLWRTLPNLFQFMIALFSTVDMKLKIYYQNTHSLHKKDISGWFLMKTKDNLMPAPKCQIVEGVS